MKKIKHKKGVTIVVVTIISACIAIVMACTFVLTSKYNSSIIKKESELRTSLNNDGFYGVEVYFDQDE